MRDEGQRRRAASRKLGQEGRGESPSTVWPTGLTEMDVPPFAEWLRRAQTFDRGPVDEAAEAQIEEGVQLDELVHAHLALPIQHVSEPFTVSSDAPCELGDADAPLLSLRLNENGNLSTSR